MPEQNAKAASPTPQAKPSLLDPDPLDYQDEVAGPSNLGTAKAASVSSESSGSDSDTNNPPICVPLTVPTHMPHTIPNPQLMFHTRTQAKNNPALPAVTEPINDELTQQITNTALWLTKRSTGPYLRDNTIYIAWQLHCLAKYTPINQPLPPPPKTQPQQPAKQQQQFKPLPPHQYHQWVQQQEQTRRGNGQVMGMY